MKTNILEQFLVKSEENNSVMYIIPRVCLTKEFVDILVNEIPFNENLKPCTLFKLDDIEPRKINILFFMKKNNMSLYKHTNDVYYKCNKIPCIVLASSTSDIDDDFNLLEISVLESLQYKSTFNPFVDETKTCVTGLGWFIQSTIHLFYPKLNGYYQPMMGNFQFVKPEVTEELDSILSWLDTFYSYSLLSEPAYDGNEEYDTYYYLTEPEI